MLMIGGAAASVLSYFSGDAEADRLWDTMSPAAQQILASSTVLSLPVPRGARAIPDVRVSDSCGMARDARVIEPP